MSDTLSTIDLDRIRLSDQRFCISPFSETRGQGGLVPEGHPALVPVLKPENNDYIPVIGGAWLRHIQRAGQTCIQAIVLDDRTSDCSCLCRAVAFKSMMRPLLISELIRSVFLLRAHHDTDWMAGHSSQLFNQAFTPTYLDQILAVSGLGDPALCLIHSNRLSFKAARMLCTMEAGQRELILSVFERIKLSTAKQVELILHLKDICLRDSITLQSAFQQLSLDALLNDPDPDKGKKEKELRSRIFKARFPELSEARQERQAIVSGLKIDPCIHLDLPEFFESRQVTIAFKADSIQSFRSALDALSRLKSQPGLDRLFSG